MISSASTGHTPVPCVKCGYDIRGSTSTFCSECGYDIEIPCASCEFNLAGRLLREDCPSCGHPVAATLALGDSYGAPEYWDRFQNGVWIATLAMLFSPCYGVSLLALPAAAVLTRPPGCSLARVLLIVGPIPLILLLLIAMYPAAAFEIAVFGFQLTFGMVTTIHLLLFWVRVLGRPLIHPHLLSALSVAGLAGAFAAQLPRFPIFALAVASYVGFLALCSALWFATTSQTVTSPHTND